MSLWLLLFVGVALGIALLAVGVHMIRPSWGEQGTRADVGVAVVTTTVISLAIFVLQILDENRLQREDAKRQDEAANQALRLQLGLSSNLNHMDLSGHDLRAIVLPQKSLRFADFSDADLADANLQQARLTRAIFRRTDLEGADLKGSNLEGADFSDARLDGGDTTLDNADLRHANLHDAELQDASLEHANLRFAQAQGANFRGATTGAARAAGMYFDNTTVFPNGRTISCTTGLCKLTAKQWRAAQR